MNGNFANGENITVPILEGPSVEELYSNPPMELYVLEHRLEVCSIPKHIINEFTHSLIKIAFLADSRPEFFSFTETAEDYTVITTRKQFEEIPKHDKLQRSNHPWRALTVSAGEMGSTELAGVSKIAKSVIGPLADKQICVLVMSTYQSDYILVQEPFLQDAIQCLAAHFKIYNEYEENIASPDFHCSDSFQPVFQSNSRPVVTSHISLPESYHITGLDLSLLPSVVQVLLEIMFFSCNAKSGNFFHYSIIEEDISLILDSKALEKFPPNTLYTSSESEKWRMINIGDSPFEFNIYGVVANVAEPLANKKISTYYVSTYKYGHTLVYEKDLHHVLNILQQQQQHKSVHETSTPQEQQQQRISLIDTR
eukprot:gene14181-15660_t